MFSLVNISQLIGWEDCGVFCASLEIGCKSHLQNDLYCVERIIKPYTDQLCLCGLNNLRKAWRLLTGDIGGLKALSCENDTVRQTDNQYDNFILEQNFMWPGKLSPCMDYCNSVVIVLISICITLTVSFLYHRRHLYCLDLHCVQKKNTHSHFLSYLHEWCVDLNKNCSECT